MILEPYSLYGNSETLTFIESVSHLDEYETRVSPSMVNVVYNDRLDKELIKLESFVEYADSNDIDDGGLAIANICEENRIPLNSIGFMVEESSILESDEVFDTARQLRENGFLVAVTPISSESTYYQTLEEALELDEPYSTYSDSIHLISYCEGFAPLEKAKEIGRSIKNRVGKNYDAIKSTLSEQPKKLAKKLSAIKKMIAEKNKQLRTAAGDAKVVIKNKISKLKDAFGVVKDKLIAAKDSAVKMAGKAKDTVVSGARYAGKWVSDRAGDVKNTVIGAKRKVFG